ncbi:hypothetical protein GCM10028805_58300 [Spirosoma harenae]
MVVCQIICLLTLLLSTPFLASGQKVIDLTNKTFIMELEGDTTKAGNDLQLLLLFHKDARATFRTKRGTTIIKDSPLSWRFTGDSLWLQPRSISFEAGGKTQLIDREIMKFFIVKTSGGYLLKRKDDQMLLVEQK